MGIPRGFPVLLAAALLAAVSFRSLTTVKAGNPPPPAKLPAPTRISTLAPLSKDETKIWLVETRQGQEMYSNGLRIEVAAAVDNEPRKDQTVEIEGTKVVIGQTRPAGIVFHTTESHIAPFEAQNSLHLQRVGRWLIDFVARNKSYHYLIDRFGRVHRIVNEDRMAYHAGHSAWADKQNLYAELNGSFLSISLESETKPGDQISDSVTPAQVHSLRTLTAMLRVKYGLDSANCVTHAQVSLNPENYKVGNHTDWAANFPFGEIGLPDNYAQPLPAIVSFGFTYDDDYRAATGARMWKSLAAADKSVATQATERRLPADQLVQKLRQRYRGALAAVQSIQNNGAEASKPETTGQTAAAQTLQ